jgi:hypothetical protein
MYSTTGVRVAFVMNDDAAVRSRSMGWPPCPIAAISVASRLAAVSEAMAVEPVVLPAGGSVVDPVAPVVVGGLDAVVDGAAVPPTALGEKWLRARRLPMTTKARTIEIMLVTPTSRRYCDGSAARERSTASISASARSSLSRCTSELRAGAADSDAIVVLVDVGPEDALGACLSSDTDASWRSARRTSSQNSARRQCL